MNTTLPASCHSGHNSSLHSYHPGQTHPTTPTTATSPHASPFGPTLSNKRRSHADLLFVPIKIKEKRNSCASTASSADSYRPDDTMEHTVWHPKAASTGSTTLQSRAAVPLESQTSPSVARKLSVTKGSGKATAGGATSSPKTFQCTGYPGCNMVFTRSEHLARHERKHTGEKPYKCIVPNCPRTFSRYDNMIQHTQTHGDRTKRDSLSAAGAAGGANQSRPASLQSTPLVAGRPRGGSSPGVFGAGYDDPHFPRSLQSSPAGASFGSNPAFAQQHHHHHPHHAYSPYYSHFQQQQQHPSQWATPSGTHASSSQGAVSARHPSIHNGESKPYFPPSSGSSTPVIRTLKANSRSLPHLQPRSSPSVPSDSPGMGQHHGMSGMEIEELKRRKSEILLPSYSGPRATNAYSHGPGIGLGMSPFTPGTPHSHALPQGERMTPQEQERLNEHRRSVLAVHQPRRDSRGRMTPPDYTEPSQGSVGRSGSIAQSHSSHPHPMSAQEKERLLEHRRSTPELMYDSTKAMKRSSNDPTDMIVQPLPSRDTRTGRQWYSQVNTSLPSSLTINPRSSSLAAREGQLGHGGGSTSVASAGEDASTVLPPIAGSPHDHRQSRPRSHSSHIHPLSRPSEQLGASFGSWPSSRESELKDRPLRLDPTLSPRLEQYLEDRHFPIRKREVLDFIERMDAREFFGLKSQVAETYANEQFRNPEFLGNMTAVLCAIQAPHPSLKRSDQRQLFGQSGNHHRASNGSLKSISDLGSGVGRSSNDMEVEEQERESSMDVDPSPHEGFAEQYPQQRVVLDIDMDSFRRDPEPDVRGLDGLSIKSLEPTTSFVAGFEPVMDYRERADGSRVAEEPPRSVSGYPLNARIGRFYLPKFAYRTRESLVAIQQLQEEQRLSPSGPWVCCQFEEYRGLWVWVLESVLEKYHEISLRHKMALTLVGARVHHPTPQFVQDEWSQQPHGPQQHDVIEVQEAVLQPEMIQQVWRDLHQQYQHHHLLQQQQQQQQHQQQHRPPPQQFSPQQTHLPPPNVRAHQRSSLQHLPSSSMANRVATYEEYQRNLLPGDPRRRESFSQPGPGVPSTTTPTTTMTTTHGAYYSDYRQHPQNLHREDLSSAPSSPQSPHHDDFYPEDNQTNESASSTPQQEASSSTTTTTTTTTTTANATTNNVNNTNNSSSMHRRISIAELCNPMQSLATERERDRFQREDSHFQSSSSSPSAANSKRSSM
ncbi:hypothetical protein EC968_006430 [Mortierella alpina]|nr:hypothetical protein EC968_006430 [Mortierella alpina]